MDANEAAGLQRDVGRLEGTVAAQGEQLKAMDAKLDVIVAHIERDKGGRRALVAAGSVAGGIVGSVFAAVAAWWIK